MLPKGVNYLHPAFISFDPFGSRYNFSPFVSKPTRSSKQRNDSVASTKATSQAPEPLLTIGVPPATDLVSRCRPNHSYLTSTQAASNVPMAWQVVKHLALTALTEIPLRIHSSINKYQLYPNTIVNEASMKWAFVKQELPTFPHSSEISKENCCDFLLDDVEPPINLSLEIPHQFLRAMIVSHLQPFIEILQSSCTSIMNIIQHGIFICLRTKHGSLMVHIHGHRIRPIHRH